MKTLDSFDVKNKTVIIRVDLNSFYDPKKGRIVDNERIAAAKTTIKELSSKKAKTVVLAKDTQAKAVRETAEGGGRFTQVATTDD